MLFSENLQKKSFIGLTTWFEKTSSQFHLRFSYKKLTPKIQSQKVSRKKLLKDFHTKKARVKR